jgi:hypothetical protein
MASNELGSFVNAALTSSSFRDLIAAGKYDEAFSDAGLPPPTQAQITAISEQDWSALQDLASSFGEPQSAN